MSSAPISNSYCSALSAFYVKLSKMLSKTPTNEGLAPLLPPQSVCHMINALEPFISSGAFFIFHQLFFYQYWHITITFWGVVCAGILNVLVV